MTTLPAKIMAGGGLLGVLVASLTAWGTYGWVTKAAYAQEHKGASVEVQQEAIQKSLDAILLTLEVVKKEQDKNQDQWECDETGEELSDVRHALAGDLSIIERVDMNILKDKLNEVWVKLNCVRFID